MTWIIEVQHSSDYNLDGKWYELKRCNTDKQAEALIKYFGTVSPIPKGLRPEECTITGSYSGRPLRKREL